VQALGIPIIETPVVALDSDNGGRLRHIRLRRLDRSRLGQATTVDRVYAAGNWADPRALVPAAAGSGATAAVTINARLSMDDADRAVFNSRSPTTEVR
jgi:NADPH-dependent glutamate synthase beta subunit-like oxidoreductase